MYFMKNVPKDESTISYISANEDTGFMHLYHYKIAMAQANFNQVSNGKINTKYSLKLGCKLYLLYYSKLKFKYGSNLTKIIQKNIEK